MLDDCENHSASCCEIRLEPSPILTKVSAAGVGTTPGEGPETQRTHCRPGEGASRRPEDRKSTRLNSSHGYNSYAVLCLNKKKQTPSAAALRPLSVAIISELLGARALDGIIPCSSSVIACRVTVDHVRLLPSDFDDLSSL